MQLAASALHASEGVIWVGQLSPTSPIDLHLWRYLSLDNRKSSQDIFSLQLVFQVSMSYP